MELALGFKQASTRLNLFKNFAFEHLIGVLEVVEEVEEVGEEEEEAEEAEEAEQAEEMMKAWEMRLAVMEEAEEMMQEAWEREQWKKKMGKGVEDQL